MKINFDWHNFMSKNNTNNTSQIIDSASVSGKDIKGAESIHKKTIIDISDKVTDDFNYLDQGLVAEKLAGGMKSGDFVAVQRDFMTVMSNSMSASDFQKMKEEGFDITAMEPEQTVTILDKIKTVLAQSGTHISGYTDTLSVDEITEITGNSGYAETIAKELSYADAPVTEENIKQIDEVVDQALTAIAPTEGSLVYMVSNHLEPTLNHLYKAMHSSGNLNKPVRMTGYATTGYSKQGMDAAGVRKTAISEEDYQQIEKEIKNRMEREGLEITQETLEDGKWLLEKGLPVTGQNIRNLQDIKHVKFPLDIKQVIQQAAMAIGEGKSPYDVNLNKKDDSVYKEAGRLLERYQKISFQAVDYTVNNHRDCNLKNMENYDSKFAYTVPQLQARKTLEEVRLKMTVEANVKLLQSGYSIETAPMEDLIKHLEEATRKINENLFGTEKANEKGSLYQQTQNSLKTLPTLPLSVVGKIPYMEKATISRVVYEGQLLKQEYQQALDSYESIMTAPRADLGDSVKKAFRNVDAILQDMDMEINESNQRAIRIMGYNQITITEDNLAKIKEADSQVRNIIENLKPGMVLNMIREGKNPLEMSLKEVEDYIETRSDEFVASSEKFSEFLYKLDQKKGISESERESYIGIYRLLRQIEKSDGAVIGSLLSQNAEMSFSNLLSAVRTKKAKHTDIRIDDSTGTVSEISRKEKSISEQIESGFAHLQNQLKSSNLTPDQVLREVEKLQKDTVLEKQFAKQKLEEIRQTVKLTGKESGYLEVYHQPVSVDALSSVSVLTQKRGATFRRTAELEEELTLTGVAEIEEGILEKATKFLAALDKKDARNQEYESLIAHTEQMIKDSMEVKNTGYLDVRQLQSLYKQISVASSLAKEENYEIPMQLGDEVTSINLKIVHSTEEKGEVRITMATQMLGKVDARFVDTPDGLEGSVLTDYMDGKEQLEANADRLQKAIEEALIGTKTELKSLFFGVNEKLDINSIDQGTKNKDTDISVLYKVAKEFIYYVKDLKEV